MTKAIPVFAGLLGAGLAGNGVFMLTAPEAWYFAVPGVTTTGPFNQHFLRDIGLIFVLIGLGFVYGAARAQPLYWLSMLPLVWWANGLVRFEPRAVRCWRPALACLGAGAGLAAALWRAEDWTLLALGCSVTLASAGASLAVRRDSLVAREGPAR